MSIVEFRTGAQATLADEAAWSEDVFGYRYTGFRGIGRFEDQLADNRVGLITWPGGYLSESDTDRYSLTNDGLFDSSAGRPGLAEMFEIAHAGRAGLSIVLPTARYIGHDDLLRHDVQAFLSDLMTGHYGAPPPTLIFEIGSEFYASFPAAPDEAAQYGHIANIYMEELTSALNDPAQNLIGLDPEIAVQCGRNLVEDEMIRSELSDQSLVEVDKIVYHRFAFNATGVDRSADCFHSVMDAWHAEVAGLGGEGPDLFMSAYGVGSFTREEALDAFLAADHAQGGHLTAEDIDLVGRTHDGFEQFWQDEVGKRDYGAEHPRLLLEMLSEFHAEGMTAASSHGTDMIHPGRLSLTDVNGQAQDFVGQDLLDMMAESVTGTRSLEVNLTNDRADEVWTYGFENDDKLVVFLSTDGTPPDSISLKFEGLGTVYRQVAAEGLTSHVPEDWMARFGIADNPDIDESPEGQSFAVGERVALTPEFDGSTLKIGVSAPNEVIRLSFAKTADGAQEIAGWSDGPLTQLAQGWPEEETGVETGPKHVVMHDVIDLPMVPVEDHAPVTEEDAVADAHHGGHEGGGFLMALMPLLFLMGGF